MGRVGSLRPKERARWEQAVIWRHPLSLQFPRCPSEPCGWIKQRAALAPSHSSSWWSRERLELKPKRGDPWKSQSGSHLRHSPAEADATVSPSREDGKDLAPLGTGFQVKRPSGPSSEAVVRLPSHVSTSNFRFLHHKGGLEPPFLN